MLLGPTSLNCALPDILRQRQMDAAVGQWEQMSELMVHDKGPGWSGREFIRQAERVAFRRGHPALFVPHVGKDQTSFQQFFRNGWWRPLVKLHMGKSQTTLWT